MIQVEEPKRKGLGTVADPADLLGGGNFHEVHDAANQADTLTDPGDPASGLPIDCQDRDLIALWGRFDVDATQTIGIAILLYRDDGTLGKIAEVFLAATTNKDESGRFISETQYVPTDGFPGYRARSLGASSGTCDVFAGTL